MNSCVGLHFYADDRQISVRGSELGYSRLFLLLLLEKLEGFPELGATAERTEGESEQEDRLRFPQTAADAPEIGPNVPPLSPDRPLQHQRQVPDWLQPLHTRFTRHCRRADVSQRSYKFTTVTKIICTRQAELFYVHQTGSMKNCFCSWDIKPGKDKSKLMQNK